MMNRFFFITTFDNISGAMLASILNEHPDINCKVVTSDPFLSKFSASDKSLDELIKLDVSNDQQFYGNALGFSAFELQHKSLIEKTAHPFRKANIVLSPMLRIQFLLYDWMRSGNNIANLVETIKKKLVEFYKDKNGTFNLYRFHYFYNLILEAATEEKVDIHLPENRLFLIALAKVIAFDSADIPTPIRSFRFEDVIHNDANFIEFAHYLTQNQLILTEDQISKIQAKRRELAQTINAIPTISWENWQLKLLDKFLQQRLETVYYPHINKALLNYYLELGYQFSHLQKKSTSSYTKLLSIQLNSNRPAQLAAYFDNIDETADNPSQIEVLVNIDIGDDNMKSLLNREMTQRKFTIKYIETARPKSFCDLWRPINELLKITDPNAYFLLNISDEMLFATPGWDSILKDYVGFFPDHLFRLRASRNKFRNYFDRWEGSFAQDSIPITTKKWVDIGGDWNPCFGPDSFQQLISFYLCKEGEFSNINYLRDVPMTAIKFHGDVPAMGIKESIAWKHFQDHLKAMQICQSYPMQLEARRRAILIKANIHAYINNMTHFSVLDVKNKKEIHLINNDDNMLIEKMSYKMNRLSIFLVNNWRKLAFFSYFGDGKSVKTNKIRGFLRYLKQKHWIVKKIDGAMRIVYRKCKILIKGNVNKMQEQE